MKNVGWASDSNFPAYHNLSRSAKKQKEVNDMTKLNKTTNSLMALHVQKGGGLNKRSHVSQTPDSFLTPAAKIHLISLPASGESGVEENA